MFLRSNSLRDFCQQYGHHTLSSLHQSFARTEQFSAIITKQRALMYPCGRQLAGLRYELERDETLKVSPTSILLVPY